MASWEYLVETTEVGGTVQRNLDKMTSKWLNEFGKDGWELVNITTLNVGNGLTSKLATLVFKRPVE